MAARGEFGDFDSFAESIRGWDLDWRQLDRGSLRAEMSRVEFGPMQVLRVRFSRKFLQRGSTPPGVRTFGLIDAGVTGVRWCGREATDGSLLVFDPGGAYEAFSEPDFSANTISISEDHLRRVAEVLGRPEIEEALTHHESLLRIDPESVTDLRRRLRRVHRATRRRPTAAGRSLLEKEMGFEIPARLVAALCSGKYEDRCSISPLRLRAATRARDFIDAQAGRAPTVQEVCRVAGVSWRTLDYAFRELFGVTPKEYLQAVRLEGVRRRLLRDGPGSRIADAANDWGFWHLGQFASDYRRMFCELPSETLGRTRTSAASSR